MNNEEIKKKSLEMHKESHGKMEIKSKFPLKTKDDLSVAYTPGVAEVCLHIHKNPKEVFNYTIKNNTIGIITNGSAVLGLGNIGAEASIPVMEGKSILFKEFANIDAFPICLDTQDPKKIIEIVKIISPVFGGINLEDIKAPECFEIESELQNLNIPVMHDDQHGTAIVVLAGLINSLKISNKDKEEIKVVISGAGAAGTAISKLLLNYGLKNIIVLDSKGAIHKERDDINQSKKELSEITNPNNERGGLSHIIKNADVFIGVSQPNILKKEMIKSMNNQPIIFAMSNPNPEIHPSDAKEAGAFIIATGRSDFPNQINNVLAFPGIFRGALDVRAKSITKEMKISAAEAIASLVKNPNPENIIPSPFDKSVVPSVAEAVKKEWLKNIKEEK
jgi:malate dehydrogenase (oxaloacetate-decarboxylating)